MNARTAVALFVWLLLATIGCAPATGSSLWVDPGTVRFTPEHPRATVAIHNPGPLGRPIRDLRLSGPDWDVLRIVDDELPRTLASHDVVLLTLEVTPTAFRSRLDGDREGHAKLEFESEGDHHEVALTFTARVQPQASTILAVLLAALLSLAAGTIAFVRARPSPGPRSRAGMLGLALAFAGLFASAAALPLGPGWCSGRLGEVVGAVELAQCRVGLGGHGMVGWAADPSFAWLLVALSAATIGRVILAPRERAAPIVARLLGFGLLIAALVASLGASELSALIQAQQQTIEFGSLSLPRLGVVVQPLAFVLALLLVADAGGREADRRPELAMLGRLDDLVWAALIVALFLGAGSVPGLTDQPIPRLLHGPEIALALLAFVAKLALIMVALHRLRARPRLHAAHDRQARTVATLALVNLLMTVSWLVVARFFR